MRGLFWLFWLWPAASLAGGELCIDAARRAATQYAIPLEVMAAITLLETGRQKDGSVEAWPWAINHAGKGHWFESEREAQAFIASLIATGQTNFDIGCFQINWRWHGENASSPDQFLSPQSGADYAANFLRRLYEQEGDWAAAAGAYHSQTPQYAEQYRARFETILASLPPSAALRVQRSNSYPLFRAGPSGALGSLFPADS